MRDPTKFATFVVWLALVAIALTGCAAYRELPWERDLWENTRNNSSG